MERERVSPFGQLLRRYRLAAGLSQEALAERARVSTQAVSALERGARRTPQRETLVLLADALALSGDDRARLEATAARASLPRVPTERGEHDQRVAAVSLPAMLTSFHGRDDDVRALADAIGRHRLVTLTGTGGVGKTRLAVETARAIGERFDDGVRLIELAAIGEGRLVVHRTAEAIGAPLESPDLAGAVVAALRTRRTLLVFDTCEHVLADVSALIASILQQTEHVHVVATSRQALSTPGEVVRSVRSLAVEDAVALFVARGRAAVDTFALTPANAASVEEICRRVDGIPLALELVAPRLTVLSPREIAEFLHERFRLMTAPSRAALPRQQTMRAVLDWSFDLLDEHERTLFRRLGAFADGWTLERCRVVCSDTLLSPWDVLEALTDLVAKSLVAVEAGEGEPRFRLSESTRAYALEHLEGSGESDATMDRMARALGAELRGLRALWDGMENHAWQRAVSVERETIRSVMLWWMANDAAFELGAALLIDIADPGLVFESREIRRWYDHAAAGIDRIADTHLRASLAREIARMSALAREPVETVCALAEEAVRAARAAGDPALVGEALRVFGTALREADRRDAAQEAFVEGWALGERHGTVAAKAALLLDWAMRDLRDGAVERARERLHHCLRVARPGSIVYANTLATLGELAFSTGDIFAARGFVTQAIEALRALNLRVYLGVACCNAAAYCLAGDDVAGAQIAIAEALAVLRETGVAYYVTVALEHYAVWATLRGDDESACIVFSSTQRAIEGAGRTREATEQRGYGRAIALLEARLGHEALARRIAESAILDEPRLLEFAQAHLASAALTDSPAV